MAFSGLANMCCGHIWDQNLPSVSPLTINMFICSADTDFVLERNILQEKAIPELREHCQKNFGINLEVVDLKLGLENIIQENYNYQSLYEEKRDAFCKSSINFCPVILLGQKFGLPLIPSRISSDVYDLLRSTLRAHRNLITRQYSILDTWYRRDENSEEHEHVFKNVHEVIPDIKSEDPVQRADAMAEWLEKRRLIATLIKVGFAFCLKSGTIDDETLQNILVYELDDSISTILASSHDSQMKPIILQREIIDLKNYIDAERICNFLDLEPSDESNGDLVSDEYLKNSLDELHNRLFSYYPASNPPFSVLWRFEDGIDRYLHEEYLNEFSETFLQVAKEAISIRAESISQFSDPLVVEVFDDVWTSINHSIRLNLLAIGQEESVQTVIDYINDDSTNVPMVISGSPLSAKSPIIARSFHETAYLFAGPEVEETDIFIIARFILYPMKMEAVVQSIANQILAHRLLTEGEMMSNEEMDLIQFLSDLPKRYKFVIFIGGLDKIVTIDNEPEDISNILPENLNENVKIILATSQPEEEIPNCYLKLPIGEFSAEDYRNYLFGNLDVNQRKITSEQTEGFQPFVDNVSNMLHASIVAEQMLKLNSFDYIDGRTLPKTLDGCIHMMLDSLEQKFGHLIINRIASYITASNGGLTDQEIVHLMSMDNDIALLMKPKDGVNVFHFPLGIWYIVQRELNSLFMMTSKEGYLLHFWNSSKVEEIVVDRYLKSEEDKIARHNLLADYYLGVWCEKGKPLLLADDEEEKLVDRLLPSQEIMYTSGDKIFFNLRQYRQLPRHLLLSGRLEELYEKVLFNYNWIYHKTKALSMEEMLRDFEIVEHNMEVALVEEAIRKASKIISKDLENMSAELIGQLLPYSYIYPNIKNLVKECDTSGPVYNGFLPTYPYPKLPGSALSSTVICPSPMQNMYIQENSGTLIVKLENDANLYQYNLAKGEMVGETVLSHGHVYISLNKKYAIILDDKYENTIKVHLLSDGTFLGQIIPVSWVESRPFEQKHKMKITSLDIGNEELALVLTNEVSYAFIVDIATCKPIHNIRLDKRATMCKISSDLRFLYINSAEQLLGFNISTGQQVVAVELLAKPFKAIFTNEMSRAFVLCDEEQRVVVLHLNESGFVQTSYKIVFENSLGGDHVTDIKLSTKSDLLLIRGEKNILVYDFMEDAIISHMKRPPEIPEDFKLPNSVYTTLNFTEADFAFDDKVIVSSIFRDVLIWSIADGKPLAMLHAPVGIITKLIVDRERKGLIGYIGHSREIHLWNLNGAFTDGTVIDALTESISKICVAEEAPRAVAICENSDEMGVVDLDTGFLTDLYTHEGRVLNCAISSCGAFAIVAIQAKKPNTANIVWSLNTRQILMEFGNSNGYFLPFKSNSNIIHMIQNESNMTAPYELSIIQCSEIQATVIEINISIPLLISAPFLTPNDANMVALSAEEFNFRTAEYENPFIKVWSMATDDVYDIKPSDLEKQLAVGRIVDVRMIRQENTIVMALFKLPGEEYLKEDVCYQFMLIDISNSTVVKCYRDLLPASLRSQELYFSESGLLCIDKDTMLYSLQLGYEIGQLSNESVAFRGFILHDRGLLLSSEKFLWAYRIPEGTLIGKVNLHDTITCVSIREDQRTIIVGTSAGNVLSYTVVDSLADNVKKVVDGIKSRALLDKENSRYWDRLVQQEEGQTGNYSRPPSMTGRGRHSSKRLADIPPENADGKRPASDPGFLGQRSRTCVIS